MINQILRIGLLIPYSGVHPHIFDSLQRSIQLAFAHNSSVTLQFEAEYLSVGDSKEIEGLALKLFQFSKTDLIIGVVGSKSFPKIIALAERYKKIFIALNLGGDVPRHGIGSHYFLYNSLYHWQSFFALGKWAQQKFGGVAGSGISVYEAGYDLNAAFVAGLIQGGATEYKRSFLPYVEKGYNTVVLIDNWVTDSPDYGLALLSGNEGKQFLENFLQSNLNGKIPLLVNYFMVEEGSLFPSTIDRDHMPSLYTACGWHSIIQTEGNKLMMDAYTEELKVKPGCYDVLGFELGLVLQKTIEENKAGGRELVDLLNGSFEMGPRDTIHLSTVNPTQKKRTYILEAICAEGIWEHNILEESKGIEWNDEVLDHNQLVVSGWQNAYLCV